MIGYRSIKIWATAFVLVLCHALHAQEISLNGLWQIGQGRNYDGTAIVPGIATDPTKINEGKLWYKKTINLPKGDWQYASLALKGARFMPEIYIDNKLIAKQNGGMAPIVSPLAHPNMKPGNKIELEIALQSLGQVPPTDASYIPPADQWRSNISACLWDDVSIHFYKFCRIASAIPFVDFDHKNLTIKYQISQGNPSTNINGSIKVDVLDMDGKVLLQKQQPVSQINDSIVLAYGSKLRSWSPAEPNLYKVRIILLNAKGREDDRYTSPLGIKKFDIRNKQFYLNNEPCKVAGGTVVWHRWVRTPEGRELGYDTAWFYENIVRRLKEHGANYLRFHLGKPPEELLDLCDKYGLLVQYEWSFFHGMPASKESLLEQYKPWLDMAMRHPCVSIIHPYNETEGNQLQTVWQALNQLLVGYPPLVLEERDVIHVHKYWWSLFENLGLYYDSYQQFEKAVMIDEFGGNYLDEKGEPGAYVTVKESFLRFLGRNHTASERLAHQAAANGKVAEYWRRIGAAGIAPFCILGSWNDGNNWFMGSLKDGKEKPVWETLTAAWAPQSVSIELWDRNFTPNQHIDLPIYVFNDVSKSDRLAVRFVVSDSLGKLYTDTLMYVDVKPFSTEVINFNCGLPSKTGNYVISAELMHPSTAIKYPVVSKWPIHIFQKHIPKNLLGMQIGIATDERELKSFLHKSGIQSSNILDEKNAVILLSTASWKHIADGDTTLLHTLQQAIEKGKSVVLLDIGEKQLGQGYPKNKTDLGPLQGVARITDSKRVDVRLFGGIKVTFTEAPEPESHIHADKNNPALWVDIPKENTWLWNGLRGGLIAPALDMEFSGLNAASYLAQWQTRGADEQRMRNGNYYAYELQGFYEYASLQNDEATQKKLKDKVEFLVQDAPALAASINPQTPVKITDIASGYQIAKNGIAENLVPLVNAGKNLTRTPVIMIDFGKGKGKLIASQLLTAGRLVKGLGGNGLYDIRYDEVAVQFVLNMLSLSIKNK